MPHVKKLLKKRTFWLGSIIAVLILLVGCIAVMTAGARPASVYAPVNARAGYGSNNGSQSAGTSSTNPAVRTGTQKTDAIGSQYLVKSLSVNLEVKDTRAAANDVQSWITSHDSQATSAGMNYEGYGDNLFRITLTYSVQASLYPRVEQYVRDYASQHGGRLLSLNESVQDVSNQYVDVQSRLTSLRAEQTRLRELLSRAQAMGDILSIEQGLTDVEGKIESMEAQLKTLASQITFYPVTIIISPSVAYMPAQTGSDWNMGQILQDAFAASLGFAQGLVTFLIWLLAFSVYVIPVVVLVWLVKRFNRRQELYKAKPHAPSMADIIATTASREQAPQETVGASVDL